MNQNYQFRYDGSPEAKEAIRLINEKLNIPLGFDTYDTLDMYESLYFTNVYMKTHFWNSIERHSTADLLAPAEFVRRLKGESAKPNQYRIGEYVMYNGLKCVVSENHNKDHLTIGIPTAVLRHQVAPLSLTERIKHAYPKLTLEEVEGIVEMVKEEDMMYMFTE